MATAARPLTLMAVHAHPDDEATGTGGVFARYGSEGVRTVLVTCTNGELGEGPNGEGADDPGRDEEAVISMRRRELARSCEHLGIHFVEFLDYRDSGMMGWPQNDAPGAFWGVPVSEAAGRLGELMEQYRPQVVVTYDENGFYGHPDHIQAHRITMAAAAATGIPEKVYFTTVPRSAFKRFGEMLAADGIEPLDGGGEPGEEPPIGTDDELITTTVDCSGAVDQAFAALGAHASQPDARFFLGLGIERFSMMFSTASFVRAVDRTGAPTPEDDLFAGLR